MILTSDFLMSDSEKLYYITSSVDSTKYYKRGKNPKSLIKAKNKSEAEKFTLLEAMDCTNGKKEYMYSIIPVEDNTSEIEQEVIDEDTLTNTLEELSRKEILKTLKEKEKILLQKTLKKEVIDDKIYLEVFFKVYENIALEKEPSPDLENED